MSDQEMQILKKVGWALISFDMGDLDAAIQYLQEAIDSCNHLKSHIEKKKKEIN